MSLTFSPTTVDFEVLDPDHEATSTMTITNSSSEAYAIKFKTTKPGRYATNAEGGLDIVPPHGRVDLIVHRKKDEPGTAPALQDKFCIEYFIFHNLPQNYLQNKRQYLAAAKKAFADPKTTPRKAKKLMSTSTLKYTDDMPKGSDSKELTASDASTDQSINYSILSDDFRPDTSEPNLEFVTPRTFAEDTVSESQPADLNGIQATDPPVPELSESSQLPEPTPTTLESERVDSSQPTISSPSMTDLPELSESSQLPEPTPTTSESGAGRVDRPQPTAGDLSTNKVAYSFINEPTVLEMNLMLLFSAFLVGYVSSWWVF